MLLFEVSLVVGIACRARRGGRNRYALVDEGDFVDIDCEHAPAFIEGEVEIYGLELGKARKPAARLHAVLVVVRAGGGVEGHRLRVGAVAVILGGGAVGDGKIVYDIVGHLRLEETVGCEV